MTLKIENFGLVKNTGEEGIKIDGITVITGDNDTGKSTVGKVLFSLFHCFYNQTYLYALTSLQDYHNRLSNYYEDTNLVADIDNLRSFVGEALMFVHGDASIAAFESTSHALEMVELAVSDFIERNQGIDSRLVKDLGDLKKQGLDLFMKARLSRILSNIFDTTLNNVHALDSPVNIQLQFNDGDELSVSILNNQLTNLNTLELNQDIIFSDTPQILNKLNQTSDIFLPESKASIPDKHLAGYLRRQSTLSDKAQSARRTQIEHILAVIDKAAPGHVAAKDGKYIYTDPTGNDFAVHTLSSGLKIFSIIKILLLNGAINYKDTLVLDEPEIYIHPDWQLLLAEAIILLQRDFDLHILLTTHSTYFLEAIDTFSRKHGIDAKCKYYTSRKGVGGVTFDDMTERLPEMYDHLSKPFFREIDRLEREQSDD